MRDAQYSKGPPKSEMSIADENRRCELKYRTFKLQWKMKPSSDLQIKDVSQFLKISTGSMKLKKHQSNFIFEYLFETVLKYLFAKKLYSTLRSRSTEYLRYNTFFEVEKDNLELKCAFGWFTTKMIFFAHKVFLIKKIKYVVFDEMIVLSFIIL